MKVDLNKQDLISLIKGVTLKHDLVKNPAVQSVCYYVGGFNDRWYWDNGSLNQLSESELWEIYQLCKKQV